MKPCPPSARLQNEKKRAAVLSVMAQHSALFMAAGINIDAETRLMQAMIAAYINIDAEIADFAGLYNHLVAKQRMGPTEAAEYVARQYDIVARKKGVPTLAESDGRGRSSLYTLAAAAASWDGVEKHSIPYAESFVGVAIGKVLKRVHPDTNITMQGKKTVEDMLAYVLDAVAKVAGHSCRAVTTRFCHVPTGSYLDPEYAKADCNAVTVLQTRTVPSDQVLLARLSEGEFAGQAWWESRGEVVRVGLGGAVAQHEAKDPSERGNALLEHLKRAQEQPGEDTARAIVMAVRQVFPGELAKHAVSEATKALTKYRDAGVALPRFDAASGGLEYGGNTAGVVGDSIDSAAGLQFPVLGVAHMMSVCAGRPPSTAAAVCMSAVLEYMCAELLELAGNTARDNRSEWIVPRHLNLVIINDEELRCMFRRCSILGGGVERNIHSVLVLLPRTMSLDDWLEREEERERERDQDDCPRFVCGTRVDGKDQEEAQFSSFVKELQALSSVGAVLAAQDDEGAGGTQDVLASLMAKEVRTGQNGVGGGGKAKRSIILRDTIQAITEHHVLAMAARAGVVKVSPLSFEEIRYIMKVWLEEVIRKTVAIAEHGGRNTILDSDVLSAAIDCVSHEEMKIVCGTGRLAAVYAAQGADRWAGAYQAVDGNLAHPPSPFAQLAADFSSEVTRKTTNKLYNNLPDAGAADSMEEEEEEDEQDCEEEIFRGLWCCEDPWDSEEDYEKEARRRIRHPWDYESEEDSKDSSSEEDSNDEYDTHPEVTYENRERRKEQRELRKEQRKVATYPAGSRSIGSGCYPSGVPFKTLARDRIEEEEPHEDSLCYIRQMQRYKGPVLPFQPFVRIVAEIADDYRSGVSFCPSALQVLCAMLEDYVHKLFEDAHLIAIQCVKDDGLPIIYPRELQLARRLHRQRL
eukprot:Tamp_02868.p1 GENE.Tamp_02868~~Tamp_02868.p1  ORF type:complete len:917 (-),score=169.94 Tamp_02868:396-3146(-)